MTDVKEIGLSLMEDLACPRSVSVAILMRYGEWDQLLELRAAPHEYCDSESYWAAACATDFLRKWQDAPSSHDKEATARQKWWEGEQQCFQTNRRLYPFIESDPTLGPDSDDGGALARVIRQVRKEVRSIVGSGPRETREGQFGPGATLSDRSREATVAHKMTSVPTLTSGAWPFLVPWIGTEWGRAQACLGNSPIFVEGNHYFTVTKDATTHRSCAKEPSLNAYYQRAAGLELRELLKRSGIDLEVGQMIHRQVACLGSRTGEFCSIDLSNASDTMSKELVRLLLPPKWYDYLSTLRSPKTRIDGRWVLLEKFSSMGNGFTFELETVIFLAISRAMMSLCGELAPRAVVVDHPRHANHQVSRPSVLVYGDDILVPTEISKEVISALRFFGFTPNKRKTFETGAFRESCGGDFFNGVAVRPYNLEESPCEPHHFISLANGLRRMAGDSSVFDGRWVRIRRTWFRVLDRIPSGVRRLRGPSALGDLVIHDDPLTWEPRTRVRNSIRYVQVWRPARFDRIRWDAFAYTVQFAAALYLAGKAPSGSLRWSREREGLSPRDNVLGYKVGWISFS